MTAAHRALVALLATYVAGTVLIGRFTTTDEIAFKSAGREWAQSGRFAAPELTGFARLDPPVETIWFAHLPVYTFLFGVFVKLFGFGVMQSVAFDALIHAALAALTFAICRRLSPGSSPWAAFAAAALVLPQGMPGRADELAVCLALLALLSRSPVLMGALFGISGATSAAAAGLLGLHGIVVIATQPRPWRTLGIVGITAAATALACISPIVLPHPEALRQFHAHAARQAGVARGWALQFSWNYGKGFIAAALLPLVVAVASRPTQRLATRFGAGAVAAIVVLLFVPAKYYYLWFVGPILIAAACATVAERRVPRPVVALCGLIYLAVLLEPLRQTAIVALLPAEQRLAPNEAVIRRIVPAGSSVAASEFWSSIAGEVRYRSLVHGDPDFAAVDYVILTGNGSGAPGRTQTLTPEQDAKIAAHFTVVHDNLRRDVPRLLGIPLSRSAPGFGTRILRNRAKGAR